MSCKLIAYIGGIFRKGDATSLLLQDILGYRPVHTDYYRLALTHRSVMQEDPKGHRINNERLEFLGDSVLGSVMADILYEAFPNQNEGELTNFRSRLVKRETLDKLATDIGLDRLIVAAQHYPTDANGPKIHINGNAFEALIGAIYLDKGYEQVYRFVQRLFKRGYLSMNQALQDYNYKSRIIEWAQQHKYQYEFDLIHSEVNRTNNTTLFRTRVLIEGKRLGEGEGLSKKQSEQMAAREAWETLQKANGLPPDSPTEQ